MDEMEISLLIRESAALESADDRRCRSCRSLPSHLALPLRSRSMEVHLGMKFAIFKKWRVSQ